MLTAWLNLPIYLSLTLILILILIKTALAFAKIYLKRPSATLIILNTRIFLDHDTNADLAARTGVIGLILAQSPQRARGSATVGKRMVGRARAAEER